MKFIQILILITLSLISSISKTTINTDYIAAIVNENIILDSNVKDKIKIMQYNACDIDLNTIQDTQKRYHLVLDRLITDNLIFQTTKNKKENITINYDKLNQIISSIANLQNMTLTQFCTHLNSIGLSYKQYASEIYHDILKKLICNHIAQQNINYISSTEIEDIAQQLNFIDFNKQFKLKHTIIDLPIPSSSVQINKSMILAKLIIKERTLNHNINIAIKNYYNNNILPKITVNEMEQVAWKNIPVIFDQYLKTAKKGDIIGPIQSYDGIHILEIQDINIKKRTFPVIKVRINDLISKNTSQNTCIQQQLLTIKKHIENHDATFSMIIKEKSNDFYSNNHGDSLPWIDLDNFSLPIQKTLLSLKPGQISMPIHTANGWYLIQLININKLNYSEIIYERSYAHVLQRKFNEILNNWIKELKFKSYIKVINNDKTK